MEQNSDTRKKEILPFGTTWMNLEAWDVKWDESDKERQTLYDLTNKILKNYTQRRVECHVHAAIFKMDNQQGLPYGTWDSAQCYMAAWVGGEFREEWIHEYTWLIPFAAHLKLSQSC